jgi:Tol biopolymer transport system component
LKAKQLGGGRTIVALFICLAGIGAILWMTRPGRVAVDRSRLAWVATAYQLGPVGYRDPAGGVSPDGKWIAYSEGRSLIVRPIAGGPAATLPIADAQIRNLSWSADNRSILTDGYATPSGWGVYDVADRTRKPLLTADSVELRQAAWSPDGQSIAAIAMSHEGPELRVLSRDGRTRRTDHTAARIAFPAWTPAGDVACIATVNGRSRVTIPCGGAAVRTVPDANAYGPIAFSPDGATMYVALANGSGTVDLWSAPAKGGEARQLTSFSRDSYGPSVTATGRVVFKAQSYRTNVALAPAEGGPVRPLATFQSETPSWDPTGRWLGITYGTWRRLPDDANYPDIAQDAGIIAVDPERPASAVARVVHNSVSEDQSLCWSPNGKWIAFHSHKDQSDDVWLRPADGDAPAVRISFLGRGAETGWPRWSPDGKWIAFTGMNKATRRYAAYLVGIDQASGAVTRPAQPLEIRGAGGNVSHAEWIGDSRLAVINEEAPGSDVIYTIARDGGDASIVHRFATEHHAAGLGISPDGRHVAFVAPATDGFYQVFRLPIAGGAPIQVTTDPSHKTQPAWSPDGRSIAFTVWSYEAQFWSIDPGK